VVGTVILDHTQFTYPSEDKSPTRFPRWWDEFLNEAYWDVTLKTSDDTWYRNKFVHARLDGSLALEGRRGDMSVNGRLDARQGVVSYLGQLFNLRQGFVEVVTGNFPEKTVIPYLSAEAEKTVTTLDGRGTPTLDLITLVVDRAPAKEIQPRFISRNNPELSSPRVAQRALGLSLPQDHDLTPEDQESLLRLGLVQILDTAAGPLVNTLARRFGIDTIRAIYEPGKKSPERSIGEVPPAGQTQPLIDFLQGTGATAGVQLTNRIFGVYKFTVGKTENQVFLRDEIEIIYRIVYGLHLKASSELDSQKLLGQPPNRRVLLENQWRFGHKKRKKTLS
jgi:hypothetical protein